jgi:predicted DNA-binding transcriptional regulator AlpA/Zn ribbon nucleic-acid-binding protein
MSSEATVPRMLSVDALVQRTGIPRSRIYKLIKSGKGPRVVPIESRYWFAEDAVLEWIRTREETAASAINGKARAKKERECPTCEQMVDVRMFRKLDNPERECRKCLRARQTNTKEAKRAK